MVRVRPEDRFEALVRGAADVFIESQGYGRTQMEDVAKRVGVSKGTLYQYVESKAALFDLALRHADQPGAIKEPVDLPVATPQPGVTLEYVTHRLASDERFLAFAAMAASDIPPDVRAELEGIVRALFRMLYDNRRALKLIDSCAADHPELASLWYEVGRGGVSALLTPYLDRRIRAARFVGVPDVPAAARFILESCMLWAIHIQWDPHPEPLDTSVFEDTVAHFICRGLLPDTAPLSEH